MIILPVLQIFLKKYIIEKKLDLYIKYTWVA